MPRSDGRPSARSTHRLPYPELIAAVAAVLTFWTSLGGDFVWDDRILILEGQLPRAWERLGEILTRDFFARSEYDIVYGYYRPLTTLSYLLDYSVWKLQPWGYHLTNVLAHAGCAVLIANLLRTYGWSAMAAAIAATLFAVHPIHSESVAWIAGRTDVIALLFSLLALRLAWEAGRDDRRGRTLWSAAAVAAFALGLLAKETAVVTLLWLIATERLLRPVSWRIAVRRALPGMAVTGAYLIWRFGIIHVHGPAAPPIHSFATVVLSLGPTLLRYCGWLLLPLTQNAYVINPYVVDLSDPRLLVAWPILLAAAALVGLWFRHDQRPVVRVATLMLVAALIPNLSLVRPSSPMNMGATMAERFCYFPSFPFVALLGAGLDALWSARRTRRLRSPSIAVVAAIAAIAAAATIHRNRVWNDELTFVKTTLARSPQAVLLWGRLAEYQLQRRDLAGAEEALRQGETTDPGGDSLLWERAYLHYLRGETDQALAIQEKLARKVRFAVGPVRNNLAFLYRMQGRLDEARGVLEQLVQDNRGYSDVYANLAEVYRAQGNRERARTYYHEALRDRPDDLQVAGALVSLEVEDGHPEVAERIYRELLRYHPGEIRIENNIAMIRAGAGDLSGATQLLHEIIRRHPAYGSARINLAQVLYRRGERQAAVAQLEAARPLVKGTELEKVVVDQLTSWRDSPS